MSGPYDDDSDTDDSDTDKLQHAMDRWVRDACACIDGSRLHEMTRSGSISIQPMPPDSIGKTIHISSQPTPPDWAPPPHLLKHKSSASQPMQSDGASKITDSSPHHSWTTHSLLAEHSPSQPMNSVLACADAESDAETIKPSQVNRTEQAEKFKERAELQRASTDEGVRNKRKVKDYRNALQTWKRECRRAGCIVPRPKKAVVDPRDV